MNKKRKSPVLAGALILCLSSASQAGNVYLTGHDVLLHGGQEGYDAVILDYLRNGQGTRATYDVLYVTSGGTAQGLSSVIDEGFNVTTISHAAFGADPSAALAGKDVFVLPWWYDGDAAGNAAVTSAASKAALASFFNDGGDMWGNSSHIFPQYYDFLPESVAAAGPALPGNPSFGFSATAAGIAIGITGNMINGDPTHNVFDDYADAFTVFETYVDGSVISIGLLDGKIVDGGIIVDPPTPGVPDTGSSSFLLLMSLSGCLWFKKRFGRKNTL